MKLLLMFSISFVVSALYCSLRVLLPIGHRCSRGLKSEFLATNEIILHLYYVVYYTMYIILYYNLYSQNLRGRPGSVCEMIVLGTAKEVLSLSSWSRTIIYHIDMIYNT
jgi:hypothetical protein